MSGKNPLYISSYFILAVFSVLGLGGIFLRMSQGLNVTALTSFDPWGIWIVAYSFLIGISGGCVLIASLYTALGKNEFHGVVAPALMVGLISLAGGLVFVLLQLGQPMQILSLYLYPNWGTAMARLAWLYPVYFILMSTWLFLWIKPGMEPQQSLIKGIAMLCAVLALLVNWNLGSVFANHFTQHLWTLEWTPVVYVGLTVISGLGMILFLSAFFKKEKETASALTGNLTRYLLAAIFLYAVLVMEELIRNGSISTILFGKYGYLFWAGQFACMFLLPISFGIMGKLFNHPPLTNLAGLIALTGVFLTRLYVLLPATTVPELGGMATLYHGERLAFSHFPNTLEIFVFIGLFALLILIYLGLSNMLNHWVSNGFMTKRGLNIT